MLFSLVLQMFLPPVVVVVFIASSKTKPVVRGWGWVGLAHSILRNFGVDGPQGLNRLASGSQRSSLDALSTPYPFVSFLLNIYTSYDLALMKLN